MTNLKRTIVALKRELAGGCRDRERKVEQLEELVRKHEAQARCSHEHYRTAHFLQLPERQFCKCKDCGASFGRVAS